MATPLYTPCSSPMSMSLRAASRTSSRHGPCQLISRNAHSNWCPGSTIRPVMPCAGAQFSSKHSRKAPVAGSMNLVSAILQISSAIALHTGMPVAWNQASEDSSRCM